MPYFQSVIYWKTAKNVKNTFGKLQLWFTENVYKNMYYIFEKTLSKNLYYILQKQKKLTTSGIPKPSPFQVLTRPNVA